MEIIDLIIEKSNHYVQQQNENSFELNGEDLCQFVGTLVFSGYYKLPRTDLYWSKADHLSVQIVSHTMSAPNFMKPRSTFMPQIVRC